jgi:hypothetical protein
MFQWIRDHEILVQSAALFSAVAFLGTLVAVPMLIVRMPTDYFARGGPRTGRFGRRHPQLRLVLRLLKNATGVVLVVVGVAMLVLPGQGILTILVGITLLDFPGKRALALRIVRRRSVFRAMNWIRRKARQPPLELNGC